MITPDFSKPSDGLLPVIVQDARSRVVLMLGYMNAQAYEKTCSDKRVTFFSRSKNRLWTKGEESGNVLTVEDILMDCDRDTILIKALPAGPVCHEGTDTCFREPNRPAGFLYELEDVIRQRRIEGGKDSYVSSLFARGINKIAQKVGEEAVELVIEAKDERPDLFRNEAADLLFHYLVLLQARDCSLEDICAVLKSRHKS